MSGSVRTITDRETTQVDIRRLAARYEGEESAERRMSVFGTQERISYRFNITGVTEDGF